MENNFNPNFNSVPNPAPAPVTQQRPPVQPVTPPAPPKPPVTPPAPKAKKKLNINFKEFLTLPYILMAVCIFVVASVLPVTHNLIMDIVYEICGGSSYYYFDDDAYNIVSDLLSIVSPFFYILVYAACAFFANKKVSGMFAFAGVAYIAIRISDIIEYFCETVLSFIIFAIEGYYVNAAVNEVGAVLCFFIGFFCTIIAIVLGLAGFMFANKFTKEIDLKKMGKKKPAAPKAAPAVNIPQAPTAPKAPQAPQATIFPQAPVAPQFNPGADNNG